MSLVRTALVALMLGGTSIATAQPSARRPDIVLTGPSVGTLETALRARVDAFARARGLGLHDRADQPPVASDSPQRLKEAIADYHAFRYQNAIGRLDQLVAQLAKTGGRGLDPTQLADVFLYRAMSKGELGSATDARGDLLRAAALFPSYKLDEARFRPSLIAAFERARKSVLADPPANVAIEAPSGCTITVDARPIATRQLALRPGVHYLQVSCAGSLPFAEAQTFVAGNQRFAPTLTARPDDRSQVLAAGERPDLLWVALSRQTRGAIDIALIDRQSNKTVRSWSLRVREAKGAARVDGLLADIVDNEFAAPQPPPEVVLRDKPRRWYERPWVWAAIGATATAAVILPFALRDGQSNGFDAAVSGVP